MAIKPQLIGGLWAIIKKLGLDDDDKKSLVYQYTRGRSTSMRQMTHQEASNMLRDLARQIPNYEAIERMKRKIIGLARSLGWREKYDKGFYKAINNFIVANGAVKKRLNSLSFEELPKVVSQFETMLKTHLNKVKKDEN